MEHVMSLQFHTPASLMARALNPVGQFFADYKMPPISKDGIAHNVHLLRDADNNGYLTFHGTTNAGTWLDINMAFGKYDQKYSEKTTPLKPSVDDTRWEGIEPFAFDDTHQGFCT